MKAIQVYSSLRVMTLTGRHPIHYWAQMKGPRAWFPVLIGIVALAIVPAMFSALPKSLATLLMQLLDLGSDSPGYGVNLNLMSSAILLFCGMLALGSTYRILETVQTAIVVVFLALLLASFLALRPDLWLLVKNAFIVSLPDYPDWIQRSYPAIASRPNWVEVMTYVGFIGGSSTDYTAYLSFLRDKKWGLAGRLTEAEEQQGPMTQESPANVEELIRGKRWLRAPLTDVLISFGFVAAFSIIFLVLGAMILSPAQLVPHASELLTVQASFLTELHPRLAPLYMVGIVAVFLGTVYGGFELQTRALYEVGHVVSVRLKQVSLRGFRLFVAIYATASGLLLIWTSWEPVALFTPASILGGVFACGLWCFAMLWVDRKFLAKEFRMSPVLASALLVSGILLTSFGARAIYDYLSQLV